MTLVDVEEADVGAVEEKFAGADGAVAVLFDEDFGDIRALSGFVSVHLVLTMNEHYNVGVLLDGTRVAKVGKFWLATALFDGTRKL